MTANVLQNTYPALILECFFLLLGAVIMLGRNNMFRFNHPAEAQKLKQMRKVGETIYTVKFCIMNFFLES